LTIETTNQNVISDLATVFAENTDQRTATILAELVYKNKHLLSGCTSWQEAEQIITECIKTEKLLQKNN
jgi:hypothetical protein